MDMFIIVGAQGDIPRARWTLSEAQSVLREQYEGCNLSFEECIGLGADAWMAYNWSNMDVDDRAAEVAEKILRVEVPGLPPEVARTHLPFGASVHMEMRVTTQSGVTAMEHFESSPVWDSVDLGRGFLIEHFAARAGRALADHLTKGEPR